MEKDIVSSVKHQPKRFWKYINEKRKVRSGISDLKGLNGDITQIASSDADKADVLVNFFTSVFTKAPPGEIPNFEQRTVSQPFQDTSCTEENIMKLSLKLNSNKSCGPDEMHPKALEELRDVLKKPLSIIFSKSLVTGKLPQSWKDANIKAIYKKKGPKTDPGNYRLVNLTNSIAKSMEKLIRDSIVQHMQRNLLIQ
ncbi:uncharacterized protein LOC117331241 [Pecten maximus]|uniref:uncharacterized protein LOC117331241 n=1 Tax=Pecten maximus TaxID=6579 RepID=UPI001458B5A3|nr:uncharacterized protein LOC117331241 [Pecten maximus]